MHTSIKISNYIISLWILLFLTGVTGCAEDSSEDFIQKITPKDKIYTLDDLKAVGFKKSRNYKVEGLEGATAAHWGFHNKIEFEVRFYETHEDAKILGIPMAEESSGPDAKLKKEDASWDVGLKDRRMCGGGEKGTKDNVLNVPLSAGTQSHEFLNAYESIFRKLKEFKPEFILLSAGFDAHKDDPLAQINLESKDYYTLTKRILTLAKKLCDGKVVSILEGGYDLNALKESVDFHVKSLME